MTKLEGVFKNTKNYFLVNHPEILKVYKQIAGNEPNVLKKRTLIDQHHLSTK